MNANTPGSYLTEQVDRQAALLAKVATSTEHKKIEDMPGVLVEDNARVVLELSKSSNEEKM
jgi:hypothetical protein